MSRRKKYFRPKPLKKVNRWFLTLLLLPTLWAVLKTTFFLFPSVALEGVQSWWLYAAGALVYLGFEKYVHKPMWFYVWGHELTHAFSGLLTGAKIYSIRANSKKGEVRLSKSNAFVALSPYVFPFYSLVVLFSFWILQFWWTHPAAVRAFQFLIGFTLSFHASFTWDSLHRQQPDLKILGMALSGVLIIIGNTLILGVLTVSLFKKTPTLKNYGSTIWHETTDVWTDGYQSLKPVLSNFGFRFSKLASDVKSEIRNPKSDF